ncbi:MAG: hypothetical protein KHX03_09035 [Clostridium sp.]|nr:hypothetical protein [Clostridium sp.]
MLKDNYSSTAAAEFVVYPPTFIDCVPMVKITMKQKIKNMLERIVKIDLSLKKRFSKLW